MYMYTKTRVSLSQPDTGIHQPDFTPLSHSVSATFPKFRKNGDEFLIFSRHLLAVPLACRHSWRKQPLSKMFARIAKKTVTDLSTVGRRGISRSSARLGGDHHHQHYVFEGEFSKGWAAGLCLFITVGGVATPFLMVKYQNWKHGFPREE